MAETKQRSGPWRWAAAASKERLAACLPSSIGAVVVVPHWLPDLLRCVASERGERAHSALSLSSPLCCRRPIGDLDDSAFVVGAQEEKAALS